MSNRIFIRVDGSSEIGLGHINRCLSLACFLKDDFELSFFCKDIPQESSKEILDAGFRVILVESESVFLSGLSSDYTVILDGYHFSSDYQKQIKEKGCRLVCIDDIQDRHYYADVLINHGPGINISDFSAEKYTQFLTGTEYMMLRSPFLNASKNHVKNKEIDFLICIGGADSNNYTSKIVNAISGFDNKLKITAIIGNAYRGNLWNTRQKNIDVLNNLKANEIADVMQISSVGIFPSSTVAFESVAMRLPFLTFYFAENQKIFYQYLISENLALPLDVNDLNPDDIRNSTEIIKSNYSKYKNRFESVIDFKSKERFLETFKKLTYEERH